MWDPYAEFETAILPNGLTIHCLHWPNRPWTYFGCLVQSGSNQDPPSKEGLAHFVEHRVSDHAGVSDKEMRAFGEKYGGVFNLGETNEYQTCYKFFLPTDPVVLRQALNWYGTMLLDADLSKDDIEDERAIITREFHHRQPSVRRFDRKIEYRKFIFDNGALAPFHIPLGTLDTIASITPEDVEVFYRKHYTPANMVLLCVGGLSLQEWMKQLSASPFALEKSGTRTLEPPPLFAVDPFRRYVREIVLKEDNPNSTVTTGKMHLLMRLPRYTDQVRLGMLRAMFQKVMHEEIRTKRNLAYAFHPESGWRGRFNTFGFYAEGLDERTLLFFEELMDEIIASMSERIELFKQLQHAIIQSFSMKDLSASDVAATATDDLLSFQRIRTFHERRSAHEALTMEDMREMLPRLVRDQRWVSITRP